MFPNLIMRGLSKILAKSYNDILKFSSLKPIEDIDAQYFSQSNIFKILAYAISQKINEGYIFERKKQNCHQLTMI